MCAEGGGGAERRWRDEDPTYLFPFRGRGPDWCPERLENRKGGDAFGWGWDGLGALSRYAYACWLYEERERDGLGLKDLGGLFM